MTTSNRTPFTLFDLARVLNGRITQTHHNACPSFDGLPCNCGEPSYRIVRSRPARKVRGRS
jgi:hypothetical protein